MTLDETIDLLINETIQKLADHQIPESMFLAALLYRNSEMN